MSLALGLSSSTPPTVRAAQAVSLFVSATAAGASLGLSVFLIPRLLESPTGLMLRQWQRMYHTGRIVFPTAAITAAAAFGYVGYASQAPDLPLAAAALCFAIMPYTFIVLMPTNRVLEEHASAAGVVYAAHEEASARQLVDRWATLSLGRPLLLTAGAIVGLIAYL